MRQRRFTTGFAIEFATGMQLVYNWIATGRPADRPARGLARARGQQPGPCPWPGRRPRPWARQARPGPYRPGPALPRSAPPAVLPVRVEIKKAV